MEALQEICDFVNAEPPTELREALRTLLRANNGLPGDVAAASRVLDRHGDVRVGFVDGGIAFESQDSVLRAVAQAMADGTWARVKACRADDCRWAYVDTSRNRSRQWCDMTICGNREKARRYRSRHA